MMQNGTRKGAGAQAMPTMRTSPGLEDIWQLHWAYGAGIEQNSAGVFIANVDERGDNRRRADGAAARRRSGSRWSRRRRSGRRRSGPAGCWSRRAAGGRRSSAPAQRHRLEARRRRLEVRRRSRQRRHLERPVRRRRPRHRAGGRQAAGPGRPGAGPGGPGGGRGGGAAAAHSPAYWIKVSAEQNGTFTVTNSRNRFSKTYTKR